MNNSNQSYELIKKSRELYFKKGSLRRYCLRDEIANSWIKFNLLKTQNLELTNTFTKKERALKLLSESLSKMLHEYNYKIYILLDNEHIYDFSFKKTRDFYSTGAEIAFKIKKDFTVFKEEHISERFDDSFTHGFSIKENGSVEYILGIYGEYSNYSESNIKEIREFIYKKFVESNKIKSTNNYIDYKEKYKEISHHYMPIVLIGESGTGKKYFVNEIHKNFHSNRQLKILECKDIVDINECLKTKSNIVLYLKNIEWLSYKNQVKMASYIDSKLVYSNQNKSSHSNNIILFLSVIEEAIEDETMEWIDRRLLTRLTANKIHFKSVNKVDKTRIFDIIESETKRQLTDESKAIIGEFSWENNWKDLKKMIEYIKESSKEMEIKLIDLPKLLTDRNPEITTIKEAEKELIERSLKVFDDNITLAAKALGVSRSTLYRKVKEYDLA